MIRFAFAAFALGCCFVVGCKGHRNTAAEGPDPREALAEVGRMLKALAAEGRKPPAKQIELESVEPMLPHAYPMFRDGTLVYVWNTPFDENGTKVAAYEKKAATDGGWVLLQDGSVKEMNAGALQGVAK